MNDRHPYIIKALTLTTYSGRQLPVEVVEKKILYIPLTRVKEKVLNAFSSMKDKPVDVRFEVKYV